MGGVSNAIGRKIISVSGSALKHTFWGLLILACPDLGLAANNGTAPPKGQSSKTIDRVIERIREKAFVNELRQHQPLLKTYLQKQTTDEQLGKAPKGAQYVLDKPNFSNGLKVNSCSQEEFSKLFVNDWSSEIPQFLAIDFPQTWFNKHG